MTLYKNTNDLWLLTCQLITSWWLLTCDSRPKDLWLTTCDSYMYDWYVCWLMTLAICDSPTCLVWCWGLLLVNSEWFHMWHHFQTDRSEYSKINLKLNMQHLFLICNCIIIEYLYRFRYKDNTVKLPKTHTPDDFFHISYFQEKIRTWQERLVV